MSRVSRSVAKMSVIPGPARRGKSPPPIRVGLILGEEYEEHMVCGIVFALFLSGGAASHGWRSFPALGVEAQHGRDWCEHACSAAVHIRSSPVPNAAKKAG